MNARAPIFVWNLTFSKAMKTLRIFPLLPALAAGLLLAMPASSLAGNRKITVYRDNDGDGHYTRRPTR